MGSSLSIKTEEETATNAIDSDFYFQFDNACLIRSPTTRLLVRGGVFPQGLLHPSREFGKPENLDWRTTAVPTEGWIELGREHTDRSWHVFLWEASILLTREPRGSLQKLFFFFPGHMRHPLVTKMSVGKPQPSLQPTLLLPARAQPLLQLPASTTQRRRRTGPAGDPAPHGACWEL